MFEKGPADPFSSMQNTSFSRPIGSAAGASSCRDDARIDTCIADGPDSMKPASIRPDTSTSTTYTAEPPPSADPADGVRHGQRPIPIARGCHAKDPESVLPTPRAIAMAHGPPAMRAHVAATRSRSRTALPGSRSSHFTIWNDNTPRCSKHPMSAQSTCTRHPSQPDNGCGDGRMCRHQSRARWI